MFVLAEEIAEFRYCRRDWMPFTLDGVATPILIVSTQAVWTFEAPLTE